MDPQHIIDLVTQCGVGLITFGLGWFIPAPRQIVNAVVAALLASQKKERRRKRQKVAEPAAAAHA